MTAEPPLDEICPYLAHRANPAERTPEPSGQNACYAAPQGDRPWSPLFPFQQSVLCLTDSHPRCTRLASAVAAGIPTPPVAGGRIPVPAPNPFTGAPHPGPAARPSEPAGPSPEPGPAGAEPPPSSAAQPPRRVVFRVDDQGETSRTEGPAEAERPREPRRRPRWWPFR